MMMTMTMTKERQKESKNKTHSVFESSFWRCHFRENDEMGSSYYAYSIEYCVNCGEAFSQHFPNHNPALPPPYLSTNSFAALNATSLSSLVISFVVYTFSINPLDFTICSNVCTSWFFGKE